MITIVVVVFVRYKVVLSILLSLLVLLHSNSYNTIACYGWIIQPSKIITTTRTTRRKTPVQKSLLLNNQYRNNNPWLNNNKYHHPYNKRNCAACTSTQLFYDRNGYSGGGTNNNNNNNNNNNEIGLNELHTKLRDAVQKEDYIEAGRISDLLLSRMISTDGTELSLDEKKIRRKRMSWRGLGAAPWLIDRLDALQYTLPTTIQINAMEAVNSILNDNDNNYNNNNNNDAESSSSSSSFPSYTSLEERTKNSQSLFDMGIVISGTTGSGKTLAFAVPLLSILSDSLFVRQRLRISDEEAVGDTAGDLVDRITIVTSPQINSPSTRRPLQPIIAIGASMGRSGNDVKSPLALIVVPTRELGIQTATLLYQLVGGSIKQSPTEIPNTKTNFFRYKGPKGIRIGCVLDNDEAEFGLKLQTDIAITTPQYLSKLLSEGDIDPTRLRVIVYDEADLALEQTKPKDLLQLFEVTASDDEKNEKEQSEREYTRLTFLVGASVTEALGNLAVSSRILPPGKSYIATATRYAPLRQDYNKPPSCESSVSSDNNIVVDTTATDDDDDDDDDEVQQQYTSKDDVTKIVDGTQSASLKDLNLCLYPGLQHQRVIVKNETGLLVLTRLLRNELEKYEQQVVSYATNPQGPVPQRPRVVVFFPDEAQAKKAIVPLRDALWGEHRLCVLLPTIGVNPLTIMDQFKNNETSVMLATPNSVRGLDFPALTHVYTLYLPMNDPREYVHLAGRVGRVGQYGSSSGIGGYVVSILKEGTDANSMDLLARTLGFTYTDIPAPTNDLRIRVNDDGELITDDTTEEDEKIMIEKMRRLLEDTISLLDVPDDEDATSDSTDTTNSNESSRPDDNTDDDTNDNDPFQ